MLKLFSIRSLITVWKRSIRISALLSSKWWRVISVLSVVMFWISLSGFLQSSSRLFTVKPVSPSYDYGVNLSSEPFKFEDYEKNYSNYCPNYLSLSITAAKIFHREKDSLESSSPLFLPALADTEISGKNRFVTVVWTIKQAETKQDDIGFSWETNDSSRKSSTRKTRVKAAMREKQLAELQPENLKLYRESAALALYKAELISALANQKLQKANGEKLLYYFSDESSNSLRAIASQIKGIQVHSSSWNATWHTTPYFSTATKLQDTSSKPIFTDTTLEKFNFSSATNGNDGILSKLAKLFLSTPTILIQNAVPDNKDSKKDLLFWVSLFGLIVSPLMSIATGIFTWISLNRRKAEEILLRLELQKRELEIEQLRRTIEREQKEEDRQNACSLIIPGY